MKNKGKEPPPVALPGFATQPRCTLPVWDDASMAQEDWGAALHASLGESHGASSAAALAGLTGAAAAPASSAKESKAAKSSREVTTKDTSCYEDHEGRAALLSFVEWGMHPKGPAAKKKKKVSTPVAHEGEAPQEQPTEQPEEPRFVWRRPIEVVKPFRPVVHRNATPFIDPYEHKTMMARGPQPFDAKLEEAKYRVDTAAINNSANQGGGGRAGGAGGNRSRRSSQAAVTKGKDSSAAPGLGPWHHLYPETVSLLEDLVGQDTASWTNLKSAEAVARYRELATLMDPYNPALVAGCAETPAEACRSRYSTALRHRLQQAEALAALDDVPPFLMGAFNSALLAVEQSQHLAAPGNYLWELIYPHAPGTCHPVYNPYGKYAVKLYVDGAYRKILVDDALPVDPLGRPLITVTSRRELWPALLVKAIFKALGPGGQACMIMNPDTIVSCLMGNWVPQFLSPRRSPVASTAMLLTYQEQLRARYPAITTTSASFVELDPDMEGASSPPDNAADGMGGTLPPKANDAKADAAAAKPSSASSRGSRVGSASSSKRARASSAQRKGKVKEVPETKAVPDVLFAEEFCPPVEDTRLEQRPLMMCGLRTTRPSWCPAKVNAVSQLFLVLDVLEFRNTLAVCLATTPKSPDMPTGVFEMEHDAKDVQDVLTQSAEMRARGFALSPERLNAASVAWYTLEELSQVLDNLVVWLNFDGRYLHSATVETTNTAAVYTGEAMGGMPVTPESSSMATAGAGAAGASSLPTPAHPASTAGATGAAAVLASDAAREADAAATGIRAVTWLRCNSSVPEELALVIASPFQHEEHLHGGVLAGGGVGADGAGDKAGAGAAAAGAAAGAGAKGGKNAAPAAAAAAKGKPAKASRKGEPAKEVKPAPVVGEEVAAVAVEDVPASPKSFATPMNPGHRTPKRIEPREEDIVVDKKRVQIEYYSWERTDPLCQALSLPYENGKTTSHLFRIPAGLNMIKVTIPDMRSSDQITFHANTRLTLASEMVGLLSVTKDVEEPPFHIISDAGAHPPVRNPEEEVVWLKRCFNVTTETKITVVLSSLLPSENVVAHRYAAPPSHAAAILASAGGGAAKGGGGKSGGGGGNRRGSVGAGGGGPSSGLTVPLPGEPNVKQGAADEVLDCRSTSMPILKFTRLLLVDLDRGPPGSEAAAAGLPRPSCLAMSADEGEATTDPLTVDAQEAAALNTTVAAGMLIGHAGQLPMLTVRPNKRGYLLMAYTSVPTTDVAQVKDSFMDVPTPEGGEDAVAGAAASVTDDVAAPKEDLLYGRGLWNLTFRSNKALQRFEPVVPAQQTVPFAGTLRRGGASSTLLFRYKIAVSEVTHLSVLTSLSERVPIPFDLTVKRCRTPTSAGSGNVAGAGAVPISATAARVSMRSVTSSAAAVEEASPIDASADCGSGGRDDGEVIIALRGIRDRVFVPDVLLVPAATAPTVAVGRGEKSVAVPAMTYQVEATVDPEAAEEWDELCRITQEQVYVERRDEAIRTVAATLRADAEEKERGIEAYAQRKVEELERKEAEERAALNGSAGGENGAAGNPAALAASQIGATSSAANSGASRRRRSMDRKKVSAAGGAAAASVRGMSSTILVSGGADMLAPSNAALMGAGTASRHGSSVTALDSTPEELVVRFHGTFFLSSAKAEVKDAVPPEDSVAHLRSMWKNFAFSVAHATQSPADTAAAPAPAVKSAGGAGAGLPAAAGGGAKGSKAALSAALQQQQQLDTEEHQRVERGRALRRSFLGSPLDAFQPYLRPRQSAETGGGAGRDARSRSPVVSVSAPARTDGPGRRDPSKTAPVSGEGNLVVGGHVLVMVEGEEENFAHAAPLTPRSYAVRLLPLRDADVCAPAAPVEAGAADGTGAAGLQTVPASAASKRSTARPGTSTSQNAAAAPVRAGSNNAAAGHRDKDKAAAAAAAASDGSATGGAAELLHMEETRRANDAFRTLIRSPLAAYTLDIHDVLRGGRDKLLRPKRHTTELVSAYWEALARQEECTPPLAEGQVEEGVEAPVV